MLDAVDAALIRELQRDGRATFQALADRVGLSRTAVRARVQQLLDARVVGVVGIVHAEVAGLAALGQVSVQLDGPARVAVAAIAKRDAATFVSLTAGRAPVVVELRARDDVALAHELNAVRDLPGVSGAEVFRCVEVIKDITLDSRTPQGVALDPIDWRLVQQLQQNGRTSYAQLARTVGLSQAAARARVVRLLDSGAVRVTALVDSTSLGVSENIGFGLRVRGDADVAGRRIAELPGIQTVLAGFGRFDVVCGATAADRAGLVETLEAVRSSGHVRHLEAWQHLSVVKESYEIDVTNVPGYLPAAVAG